MTIVKPVENRLKHELEKLILEKEIEYVNLEKDFEIEDIGTREGFLATSIILFFERYHDRR